MSALIHPKTITVDGLSVRYAEGGQDGPDAILVSPWPNNTFDEIASSHCLPRGSGPRQSSPSTRGSRMGRASFWVHISPCAT